LDVWVVDVYSEKRIMRIHSILVVACVLSFCALSINAFNNIVPALGNIPSECITRVDDTSFELQHLSNDRLLVSTKYGQQIVGACNASLQHGPAWKAWTQYQNAATITYLTGQWVVPDAPPTSKGQTLFYWNGVEPDDTSAVLQPVLQYGISAAGGGDYWAIASWYVSSRSSVMSKLVPVNSGDVITGVLSVDSSGKWVVNATNGRNSSTLNYKPTEKYTTAYEVLEAYSINNCNEYPVVGVMDFTEISVQAGGQSVTAKWTPLTQAPITCKEHAEVVSPQAVQIYY